MKPINNRRIARAAATIWGRYEDERADGRQTIRAVLNALHIPIEQPKKKRRAKA